MTAHHSLASTTENASTRSTRSTANAPKGSLGICVRWMWTSVPAHRVKMVLNAQTDLTNTPANALQGLLAFTVSWTSMSAFRALVITVCVGTVWPLSPVIVAPDTRAACARPT